MKFVVLTTQTVNTIPLYEPIGKLGHDLIVLHYDLPAYCYGRYSYHQDLIDTVIEHNPQAVIYIGAMEEYYNKPTLSFDSLGQIGESFPLVHLCCDGSEGVWWRYLRKYYDDCHFALQVNIDGVRTGPIGFRGLTTLFPVDLNYWTEEITKDKWMKRPNLCCFSGTLRSARAEILIPLAHTKKLELRMRSEDGYDNYVNFLHESKSAINVCDKGSGRGEHVKARVIEASAAGCLVLEQRGSPLHMWFEPGKDYLEYSSVDEVLNIFDWMGKNPDDCYLMLSRMRQQIREKYSYEVFFSQILERLGLGEAIHPVKEVQFYPSAPYLCETHGSFNIVEYDGWYFLYPHHLGGFNPHEADVRRVRRYESLITARDVLIGEQQ